MMEKNKKLFYSFNHSIRMKFIVSFSVLILLFMSVLSTILYFNFYKLAKKSINEQLENNLKSAKVVVETALNSVVQNYCRNVFILYLQKLNTVDTVQDVIKKTYILKMTRNSEIYLITPRGEVIYTSQKGIERNIMELKDGAGAYYFMNIINTAKNLNQRETGFLEFNNGNKNENKSDKSLAAFIYLKKDDLILSVTVPKEELSFLVNPDDFRNDIVNLKTGETGTIELFDSNYVEIIHSSKMLEKRVYKNNVREIITANKNGELEIVEKLTYVNIGNDNENNGIKNIARIYKYEYIDVLKWYIAVGINKYEAFGILFKLGFLTIFVTILFIIIFVILFIVLSSELILNNIMKLKRGVDDFASKDFTTRVTINSDDEMGELAYSFNNMAETIQLFTTYLEEIIKEKTKDIIDANKVLSEKSKIIEDQLLMARKVQANLIPSVDNLMKEMGINVGIKYEAMENIGGDFLDVIKINDNKIGILIADVSGHGVPAALIASMAKVSFNVKLMKEENLLKILNEVNTEISSILVDMCYFLTAFVGILDLDTGEFSFCNAGHIPGVLKRKNNAIELLNTESMCIGITDKPDFAVGKVTIHKGDRLILITDGIIEAKDFNNNLYSIERMVDLIKNTSGVGPSKLADAIFDDVDRFSNGQNPSDDKAILCIDF